MASRHNDPKFAHLPQYIFHLKFHKHTEYFVPSLSKAPKLFHFNLNARSVFGTEGGHSFCWKSVATVLG